jgi:hypothetical protein
MQVIQRKDAIASFQSNETHGRTGSATASSYEESPVLPRLFHQKQQASLCCSVRTAREQRSALGLSPKVHSYAGIDLVRFLFGRNNKRLKPGHNVGRVVKNKDSKYTSCFRCRTRRSHQRLLGCEHQVGRGFQSACNLSRQ